MIPERLKSRKIFLADAIGALISVLSLLIPYSFETAFGMPANTVLIFIFIATGCAIYSTTMHLSPIKNWKPFLLVIALINCSYCLFTTYHIFNNQDTLTLLGYCYFIVEIGIILSISLIELKLSRTSTT